MKRILIKCNGYNNRKNKKSFWQIRWETEDGRYIFALQLGLMTRKEAKQASKEFSAWQKKWRVK